MGRKGNEHRIAVGVMPIAEQAGPSPSADFDISCLQGRPGNTSESNQSHSDSRRVEVLLFGGTHMRHLPRYSGPRNPLDPCWAIKSFPRLWARTDLDLAAGLDVCIGNVYFIQSVDGGCIKIGFTKWAPECRLADLQVGSPVKLTLLASFRGSKADERVLHSYFREYHSHGEWFHEDAFGLPELIAWFRSGKAAPRG